MVGYIDTVVSIGTGREKLLDPDGHLRNVILSFVQRTTNTEARHQEVLNDDAFKDVRAGYFRFQGDLALGEIDHADTESLGDIEKLAHQYLNSENGKKLIESCVARLAAK
jgi:hypothetical protein